MSYRLLKEIFLRKRMNEKHGQLSIKCCLPNHKIYLPHICILTKFYKKDIVVTEHLPTHSGRHASGFTCPNPNFTRPGQGGRQCF